jgi:tetratricopeptide (TPR) repeat protein
MSETAPAQALDDLWDFADPKASAARFQARLYEPRTRHNPEAVAETLTQLARAQGLQRDFALAHSTLDQVNPAVRDASPRLQTRYLLERGRVFNSAGEPGKAVPLFLKAWETASTPDLDFYAVDAGHMLAIALPPAEQPAWAEKAIARAKASQDPRTRGWLGPLNNNLGWSHHDAGDFEAALACFEAALEAYEAEGKPPRIRIAKWAVARALRSLGRLDDALARQQALLAELDAAGEEDGYVYEELGECLLALAQPDNAAPHFAKAYAALSKDDWLVEHESTRIERLRVLATHAGR